MPTRSKADETDALFVRAFEQASSIATSDNRLAGHLDVSRQALLVWRKRGALPVRRAMQVQKLTGVPWQHLAPDFAEVLDRTETLQIKEHN